MATTDEEEERLRTAALRNAQSILEARRRAEETLREQSEWLWVTLASIGDAVIATDADGRVTLMNPVAEALTGWPQADALGKPLTDVFRIINERDRQPAENPVKKVLEQGKIARLGDHTVLVARDGTERPIDDSTAPIRWKDGAIAGCVLVFRDVAERRSAERALAQSEARKTAILDTALDCIITCDHEGKILEFNPAAERTFGYRREDVIGREMSDIVIPPSLRRRHQQGMERVVRTGQGRILGKLLVMTGLRADGSEFPIEFSVTRIVTDRQPLFTAHLRDITERRKSEQAMAHFAAIVKYSDDAIISKDLQGIIQTWNKGAERLFGYTAAEAIGKPVTLLMPPDRVNEEPGILERLSRGEAIDRYETVRQRKDGSLLDILLTVSPIRDAEGRIIGAAKIAHDITMRKRAEEELRQYDRRKNEFLAMLAHELRNPLASIRNAVHILRLDEGDTGEMHAMSEIIERQVGQMVRMVDDLLDMSRISQGKITLRRERVELATVIRHAVETSRPMIEKARHQLTVTLPPQPVYLDADPVRLAQVIGNLLNNAGKYSEPGGRISLTAESRDGEARISIRDTGIGIPAEMLPRIFELFTQVDWSLERSQGGLGIGLTLVKRLVEMHGGTVSAHSEGPGRGSEFVVRLPSTDVASPMKANGAAPSPESADTVLRPRRILVVDDNQDSARTLATLLKRDGHETLIAYDGVEAVEAAEAFRPEVALLDIGLPKLDGYQAARKIREHPWGKSIKLAALTGWGTEDDRRKSREAGFDAHLVKPVDIDTLRKLLAGLAVGNEATQ